jgi:hypothetical protein
VRKRQVVHARVPVTRKFIDLKDRHWLGALPRQYCGPSVFPATQEVDPIAARDRFDDLRHERCNWHEFTTGLCSVRPIWCRAKR